MLKYRARKPPKTAERGLRSYAPSLQDSFPLSMVEKMQEWMKRILADSQPLSGREQWLLSHAILVVRFRQAPPLEKPQILRTINKHEEKGHSFGFSVSEMRGLNRVVLQIDQGGNLDAFAEEVERRRK